MAARIPKPRVLVLAKTAPLHDRASGDYRLSRVLDILSQGGFAVDFLSTTHAAIRLTTGRLEYPARDSAFPRARFDLLDQRYFDDLRAIHVNPLNQAEPAPFTVRDGDRFDIKPYLRAQAYDLVWVEFYYLAAEYIDDIRRFQPQARVVCDSVDLHFRRLARQCNFHEARPPLTVNARHEKKRVNRAAHRERLAAERRHADHVRDLELAAYRRCDAVVMVSEDDRDELRRHCPNLPLALVPNIHRVPTGPSSTAPFATRAGAVFVGNFDHDPNVSACVFLKHEVAPLAPDVHFSLVGSNPPRIVRAIAETGPCAPQFTVTGWVPSTASYLERARVSVAPILFGAGMNGKIGEAMSAGLPVVTTSLGALGMGLEHEKNCLVADDPAAFAAAIVRLHEDEALWERVRANGLAHVRARYAEKEVEQTLLAEVKRLLPPRPASPRTPPAEIAPLLLAPPAFPRAPKNPLFSVIVLAHGQWAYTERCLRSLAHAEKAHPGLAEYILVDNASPDGTAAFAAQIPGLRVLAQSENLGFAAGNNAGIAAARGENMVLLNNDTLVPPAWLARFAHFARAIPSLGVLGPATNTESGQRIPGFVYDSPADHFARNEALPAGAWERVRKVSGLCMMLPRAALERIGPLDTEFGIGYFEDDDLCLRAEDLGFTIAFARDVHVHHFGAVSFGGAARRARFLEEGMARFAFKWGKRGLDHIAREHQETLLRPRRPRSLSF